MSAYPVAEHVTAPAVSAPLVETAPSAQANVCEYVWDPPVTFDEEDAASVAPFDIAPTEYVLPFTVCVEAPQLTAAERVAVHVGTFPPFKAEHVQFVEPPTLGNAGETGDAVPAEQNVSEPNETAENEYPFEAVPQTPFTGAGGSEEFPQSTSAPVDPEALGSFTSPATDPEEDG